MQLKLEDKQIKQIIEDYHSLFEFFFNKNKNRDEDEVLAKIEAMVTTYGKYNFIKIASEKNIKLPLTHNSLEVMVQCNLLHYAAVKHSNKVVSFLLDIGMDTTVLTVSENKHFDKLPAWKLGVLLGNLMGPLLVIDNDLVKYFFVVSQATEEIQTIIFEAFNSYLKSIRSFDGKELIDHLLDLAKGKNCIPQLLSTKSKKGVTFIEPFALQTTPYSLKKLMQIKEWITYTNLEIILEKIRLASWKYPEEYEGFNKLCLDIREHPLYKVEKKNAINLVLNGNSFSMERAYPKLFDSNYEPSTEKSHALKRMMAQATSFTSTITRARMSLSKLLR